MAENLLRCNLNAAAACPCRNRVAHGVLNERLEDEVRNHEVKHVGIHRDFYSQPVFKPRLLDLKIALKKIQFFAQGDFLDTDIVQRITKKVAEPGKDSIGGVDVPVHQGGDGVERVEEEMGMKLHLERLKLSLCKLRLKLRGPNFPVSKLAIILPAVPNAKNRPVGENVDMIVHHKRKLDCPERFEQMERLGTEGLDNNLGNDKLKGR